MTGATLELVRGSDLTIVAGARRTVRVVAYLRVSTERQADEGQGLEVQEAAIRSWARRGRHNVVATCTDAGVSGSEGLLGRPGLAEALGHLQNGRAAALVVYRLDRLARDLILTEWLRAEVIRYGAQLRSTDPIEDLHLVDDPANPTGKLVRQILGAIAEYERDMIRLRMSAGKAAKGARGGYQHGRPPYGLRAVKGELVRDPDEQLVVGRIRRLRRMGKSFQAIATNLNESGATTRSGAAWSSVAVSRVVERTHALIAEDPLDEFTPAAMYRRPEKCGPRPPPSPEAGARYVALSDRSARR